VSTFQGWVYLLISLVVLGGLGGIAGEATPATFSKTDKLLVDRRQFDVLRMDTLFRGTALEGHGTRNFLILPAPTEGGGTSISWDSPQTFFAGGNRFAVGKPRVFEWPQHRRPGKKALFSISVTRLKSPSRRQSSERRAQFQLSSARAFYSLSADEMREVISRFHDWLLVEGRPPQILRALAPCRTDRDRFTEFFEETLGGFFAKCLSAKTAKPIQGHRNSFGLILGDARFWSPANSTSETSSPMHLIWLSEGMTLEVNWGASNTPGRRAFRGDPTLSAQYSRSTQGGTNYFPIPLLKAGIDPLEPMSEVVTETAEDELSRVEQSEENPAAAQEKDGASSPAVQAKPAAENPKPAEIPSPAPPIGNHELIQLRVRQGLTQIFCLNDFQEFGSAVAKMSSAEKKEGKPEKKLTPALVLARPMRFHHQDFGEALPMIDPKTADVTSPSQRFILCAFRDEKAARRHFEERSTPVLVSNRAKDNQPKDAALAAEKGPAYCDKAAIFGNQTSLRVFFDIMSNGVPGGVLAGTPLAQVLERYHGSCSFGGSLRLVRRSYAPLGPEPGEKSPSAFDGKSFRQIVFRDMPPRDELEFLPVLPMDSFFEIPPSR